MISFYEGNQQKAKEWISKIKSLENDVVMQLIDALLEPEVKDKLMKID